ncbi:MAG: SdiA-regulated domain-containing protein [bacterium]
MKVFLVVLSCAVITMAGGLLFETGRISDGLKSVQVEASTFPYDLDNPADKFKLPHVLDEISGISYLPENKLACVQDEDGIIYVFDLERKKITATCEFGRERDYEDIALVNNTAYVLQSNGQILEITDFWRKDPTISRLKTPLLSKKNDTEGLAFDAESNSLLITCKGSQNTKKKRGGLPGLNGLQGENTVYQFDLGTRKLSVKLGYTVGADDASFHPSGIAVHPITRDIYILSSVNKTLIVVHPEGEIIAARRLDNKTFKQPEGICFNPDGDLFISNERHQEGKANILRFNYQP